MSDFIYSSKKKESGYLSNKLSLVKKNGMRVYEYHGKWGSLAFIENHYKGFQHFSDEKFIFFIIGGPIFKYEKSVRKNRNNITKQIFDYLLKKQKKIKWDTDFSGPFCFFILDKQKQKIEIVTDLMSHIPVYYAQEKNEYLISTHSDILNTLISNNLIDYVSVADLFINKSVTFPYTLYKNIFQMKPSSINKIDLSTRKYTLEIYWTPVEEHNNKDFQWYNNKLKESINESINKIVNNTEKIGVLMSGGEDSRMILGHLHNQNKYNVKCFTFVDGENIESKIARKVTSKFNYDHEIYYRKITYYLDFLKECTRVIGTQNNSEHVHAFGFAQQYDFKEMDVVVGGLFADVYFKGNRINNIKEKKIFKVKYDKTVLTPIFEEGQKNKAHKFIKENLVSEVLKRREEHLDLLKKFRPKSYREWMMIWPSTMNYNFTNYQGNRRLFSSYEPLLDSNVVKIMASIPQEYKLDSQLYKSVIKSSLKSTKFIPHADGHYPYYGIKSNFLPTLINKSYKKALEKITKKSMGSWPFWEKVVSTEKMQSLTLEQKEIFKNNFLSVFNVESIESLIEEDISPSQKMILLQLCYGTNFWKTCKR